MKNKLQNNMVLKDIKTIPENNLTIIETIKNLEEFDEDALNLLVHIAIVLLNSKNKETVDITIHTNDDIEYSMEENTRDLLKETGLLFFSKNTCASYVQAYVHKDTVESLLENGYLDF